MNWKKSIALSALLLPLLAEAERSAVMTAWCSPVVQGYAQQLLANAGNDYGLNFEATAQHTHSSRRFNGVTLTTASGQSYTATATAGKPMYTNSQQVMMAKAGEVVSVRFNFTGTWMHGYVYLDQANDGRFDAVVDANGLPQSGSDLLAFSGYNGKTSTGTAVASPPAVSPPAFTLPATLAPGTYRLRFKVDWDNIDAGGNMGATNNIVSNGGGIIDAYLRIVPHEVAHLSVTPHAHGQVLTATGEGLPPQLPFGQALALRLQPSAGYMASGVKVRHGYNFGSEAMVHGNPQWQEMFIPAVAFRDGTFTLPASVVDGDVQVEGVFVPATATASTTEAYPKVVAEGALAEKAGVSLSSIALAAEKAGRTTLYTSATAARNTVYRDMLKKAVPVRVGDVITPTIRYSGALDAYLYIDYNEDGQFTTELSADSLPTANSELVSFSRYAGKNSAGTAVATTPQGIGAMPAFTLPYGLPKGFYRARLKVDSNNLLPEGSATLVADGGYIVDFLLNLHDTEHPLRVESVHGSINGTGYQGLPKAVTPYQPLTYRTHPISGSYTTPGVRIKHGHRLDGPQYVHGNRQWSIYTQRATGADQVIPKDSIDGDVQLMVEYQPTATPDYELVFSDEFNAEDGTQPNSAVWKRTQRQRSTWNRYMDDSEDVVFLNDGHLVARAIPNPQATDDTNAMLTGGIKSQGLYAFKYGKIEARIFTNPHTGNFPAFWLMPEDPTGGWPRCGEIDIWEAINAETTSYHTVHSHWTYTLNQKSNPPSSKTVANTPQGRWHTYGLEWDEHQLTWYVDGQKVHTYAKSADPYALSEGQWPYDKVFYIILNQSVGDGGWVAKPDKSHTYETRFDWVRVYQTKDQLTNITSAPLSTTTASPAIYDLTGRRVEQMGKGVYVINGKKVVR